MGPVLAIPCHRYYGMWQPSAALRALFAVIAPSTSSQPSSRTRDATADTDTDRGTDTDAVTVSGGVGRLPVIIIIIVINPHPPNETSFGVIVGVTTKGHSLSF